MSPLTAVQKCFHRALMILSAAHLNQRVVVTGGTVDGSKGRDEVLFGVLLTDCVSLQVLEYDGSTWTEKKERMTTAREQHAIVEVNLPALCSATGNLNPIYKRNTGKIRLVKSFNQAKVHLFWPKCSPGYKFVTKPPSPTNI